MTATESQRCLSKGHGVSVNTDGGRPQRMLETISDMQDSMVVNLAYHANDPGVGMALHCDTDRYKMFVGEAHPINPVGRTHGC